MPLHRRPTNIFKLSRLVRPTITSKRLFAQKVAPSVLTIEAETLKATANKNLTIYTYSNDRFFKILTLFGLVQTLFWANIAYFFYTVPMKQVANTDFGSTEKGPQTWWSTFSEWQYRHRSRIAGACMGLGFLVLMVTLVYPLRSVTNLTLLKGGSNLSVTTYGHFGRQRQFVVPLGTVSCLKSRNVPGTVQVPMKIRGRYFYYLLDAREGQFVEPVIFDHVVGLNRF